MIEDENGVGAADGGQMVGDHQRGAALAPLPQRVDDETFEFSVQPGAGLVENQDSRVTHHRPREAEPLSLAAR